LKTNYTKKLPHAASSPFFSWSSQMQDDKFKISRFQDDYLHLVLDEFIEWDKGRGRQDGQKLRKGLIFTWHGRAYMHVA